jgi:hypothetical protein
MKSSLQIGYSGIEIRKPIIGRDDSSLWLTDFRPEHGLL